MLRIRRFEEKCAELYSAGKIRGFLHLYIGEEAVAAGVDAGPARRRRHRRHLPRARPRAGARRAGRRDHGRDVRQGSRAAAAGAAARCTCSMLARRFYGGNAIVGGGLPLAVGLRAGRQDARRATASTACFFGEGAMAEGEFHESLNLAALWKLPVLFLCENNLYAMGTALERSEAETDLCAKARQLRHAALAGRRHGRARGRAAMRRGGRHACARRGPVLPRAAHLPVPRALDVRPRAVPRQGRGRASGRSATRSQRFAQAALARRLARPTTTRRRSRREVAAEIDDAVAFAEAGTLGARRGPGRATSTRAHRAHGRARP